MKVGRISNASAEKICRRWHYSKTIPPARLSCYGVWEDEQIVGCVIFGLGASPMLGQSEGFKAREICELVRVAFSGRQKGHTGTYMMRCLKMFKSENQNIKVIYSFADTEQEHVGILYQATNWMYLGMGGSKYTYFDRAGRRLHSRTVAGRTSGKFIKKLLKPKHKYVYPLCRGSRKRLQKICKPYPK